MDANHRAYFTARMANEWLSMRLDAIGACVVLVRCSSGLACQRRGSPACRHCCAGQCAADADAASASLIAAGLLASCPHSPTHTTLPLRQGTALLAIIRRDDLSPSLAALTMSEALDVTMFLKAAVTSGAMFETRFNSGALLSCFAGRRGVQGGLPASTGQALERRRVCAHAAIRRWRLLASPPAPLVPTPAPSAPPSAVERLIHYWSLPQEAPAKKPEAEPEPEWPEEGRIEYSDVWMRYRPELDPVLRGACRGPAGRLPGAC